MENHIDQTPDNVAEEQLPIECHSDADESWRWLTTWGTTRPFAHNQLIVSALEQAMRSGADGSRHHMFIPKVGQTFPSINDAFQFYNLYSWELGFSI
uniref:Uncharacterized protein n=1 Tax=Arundo donax TaxID=35708 RepID=A0A0A9G927_ARUDO